ncbi:zinc-binding alcohol dehydrogenase domain-containing protein cipB [Aspergillus udagawae]|nr:zinc-binding alcohol dehydrogenase domain-containing protein cipB [Aspergillus udagawae]GFG19473.1 zinc-binding alcohol dehydrogenase domain-containing protein cipB [Aspergillus udagawae]
MEINQSAWLTGPAAYPFVVENGPKPQPGEGQVLIRNEVVAVNPVDWKIQSHGRYLNTYPFILGQDAAGVVEEAGSGVTRFRKGQRVIAHCNGLMTQDPANSAFQLYTVVTEALVADIPDSLELKRAVVLPLAVSTACAGLYRKDYLSLPLPSVSEAKKTGQTILIWGGASSVGATAIQLAVASGLSVISTASVANHEFVKSLGADAVFDYRSPTVVDEIAKAVTNTEFVGVYDAIGEKTSFAAISALADRVDRPVNTASVLPCEQQTPRFAPKYVVAYSIIQDPHKFIGEWIWGEFLPKALASGRFQAKPDPYLVGNGIMDIQHALDVQKKGVSAKKVIVTL